MCLFPILLLVFVIPPAFAASHANLFVSAENPLFSNHFAGSMVVEVVIRDPMISDTSEGKGEPNVSLNGKKLRMIQGSDGSWYAYFANKEKAQIADGIAFNNGAGVGKGLDFGEFCGKDTSSSVLGASFSNTEGVAIPRSGTTGATNGQSSFSSCTGTIPANSIINNVVRSPTSINTNSGIPVGQVGLVPNAWPIIQLFSFDNKVTIQYNKAGGAQKVDLQYNDIPNISLTIDRNGYPKSAEVIVLLNDAQLNQDPTDEDSWTFKVNSPSATFYQAFTESGTNSANGGPGLVNLIPHLSNLGFEDNGILSMNLGSVVELQTNNQQPVNSVTDGTSTFTNIVTLVESQTNSGIFESFDSNNNSLIGIKSDAPRGQSGTIEYNSRKTSIVSGTFTASLSLNDGKGPQPGKRTPITLSDNDQNINPQKQDDLDVFRSTNIIPSLKIGEPITLEKSTNVRFYPSGGSNLVSGGTLAPSSVPDKNSKRLVIDSGPVTFPANFNFEMISIELNVSANDLKELLLNTSVGGTSGTNWINYDLRSISNQLGITDFSKTNMTLNFGLSDTTPIQILDPGDINSAKGLIQIDNADVQAINSKSGNVFLVINFDSGNSGISGLISSETQKQPIVFDLFSFGEKNSNTVNNAIYRFELKETGVNSGIFSGTMEYVITNQVNMFDPNLIKSLRTIDDDIRFLISERLLDEKGINISYSDVSQVGQEVPTSSKSDIVTHSGTVGFSSQSYRFGQPVLVRLIDPDLNTDSDQIDIYLVNNDPNSPNVDTVGDSSGGVLLDIKIKDTRYKRCTINGVEHGGLGATGFTLMETGKKTGVFEGIFKMPTQICDKTGTKLISTAGGSLDAKYNDFRDKFGQSNTFETGRNQQLKTLGTPPTLNDDVFALPKYKQTAEVVITGTLDNHKRGTPVIATLVGPDQSVSSFGVYPTSSGEYKIVITINHDSLPGHYGINLDYLGNAAGSTSFLVTKNSIPDWIKNNARLWSSNQVSDTEFINGLEHLIKENILQIKKSTTTENQSPIVPDWIKATVSLWTDNKISDDEFLSAMEFLVKKGIIRV